MQKDIEIQKVLIMKEKIVRLLFSKVSVFSVYRLEILVESWMTNISSILTIGDMLTTTRMKMIVSPM